MIARLHNYDKQKEDTLVIGSTKTLFRFINLTGDGSSLPPKETIVGLFSFIKFVCVRWESFFNLILFTDVP